MKAVLILIVIAGIAVLFVRFKNSKRDDKDSQE
jgi:hypothetical protein